VTSAPDISPAPQQPVIDRLLASREALLASAIPSLASAAALAALADDAVRALAEGAAEGPGAPWAVIALGGYGAGRLLPGSDLDLLIVSDASPSRVKPFAEALFYPLWDSGLPVGHQVRSRKEQLRACLADTATLTSTLTGRVVAGDAALGRRLLADVAARAHKDRKRVLATLAERERPGSPYLLEPDLKEGCGGRRDLDELAWIAAVLAGVPSADASPLVELGIISAEDLAALGRSAETLTVARWWLHRAEARHRETLSVETAEDLPLPPSALAEALATVAFTLTRVRRRLAGVVQPELPATPEALFAALDRGLGELPLMEEAAWAGALEPLVPGIRELTTLRRPGLSHTLTVGAHCLASAAFVAEAPARDAFAAEALRGIPDRRALLVAALAHDFGKREPGPGHAERGEDAARRTAIALGVPEAADDAAALVRDHLLLAETAAHADIADEDAVLQVAARIGRRELVAPLYVLTLVDTLATTPGMWTPWRAVLTRELASRLDAALSPEVEGAGIALSAERTRAEALALLPSPETGPRAFVEAAPLRYLASTPPSAVAVHAELAAPLIGTRDLEAAAFSVSPGPLDGTWRVTVATLDRPGLFATLSGVLSLSGLSILGADALPGPGETAIDVFTIESATLAPVETSTWSGFERTLRAALGGHLQLEVRLAERRRHYARHRRDVPASVTLDTSSDFATAVRVEASDRVGLLHDLARALASQHLDIRSATILTHDGIASDTFRVVDEFGEPPRHPAVLEDIERRVRRSAKAQ
jgi:[protein-PII] uridylyltransferase